MSNKKNQKLSKAASDARTRVSAYSDERRRKLQEYANKMVREAEARGGQIVIVRPLKKP
jgi:hypothetical protein